MQEYVACLNEFRMVLRQTNLKMSESHVTEEANHVSAAYHELLARANALSDAFSMVGGKYKVPKSLITLITKVGTQI
jgi:hypothetical protein